MDVQTSQKAIDNCIKAKRIERSNEVMQAFGINPEWERLNLVAPQLAATINSIPNATALFAAGVISVSALFTAVMNKHYATKDIKRLKELKDFVGKLNCLENVTEEQFYEDIAKRKHL